MVKRWEPVRVTRATGGSARSVAVVGSEVAFGRVVLLALMAQRSGDRRNPNLAVTIVEVVLLAQGVLAPLRCL